MLLQTSGLARSQDIESLERDLARVPPVTTSFIEYRFSHLLKRPTQASGLLEYRADGVMVRDVKSPRPERSEVSASEVRIQRGDRSVQRIPLQRAPQLRILLSSFRALLDGRLKPLAQDFNVTLSADHGSWNLSLRPLDARMAKYLSRIEVYGSQSRPHCLEAIEPDGDATLTLLDTTAPASPGESRAVVEKICRAGALTPAPESP
jgi:hypothetical protein